MSNYDSSEIRAGILVLVVLIGSVAFAAGVGGSVIYDVFAGGRLPCEAYFQAVGSLKTGAPVSVAGRRIGSVTEIELVVLGSEELRGKLPDVEMTGEGDAEIGARHLVRVTFVVDADLALEPGTARVALAQDSLLGDKFLELYPGYWTESNEIRQLSAYAAELDAPLPIISRAEASLLTSVMPAVNSLKKLADKLHDELLGAENLAHVSGLLTELEATMGAIHRELDPANESGLRNSANLTLGSARSTMDSLDGVMKDNRENLTVLLARLADASARADELVDNLNSGILAIERASLSLADTTGERVGRELESMLASMRRAADSLGSLSETLERDSDMLIKGRALEDRR